MADLPARLRDLARGRAALPAVRARRGAGWRHLSWAEAEDAVARACLALDLQRGARVGWRAADPLTAWVLDVALLHLGVVGEAGGGDLGDVDLDALLARRADPSRLDRLRAEVRPRDAAAVREGRVLDQAGVAARAAEAAGRLGLGQGDELVVGEVDAGAAQLAGWAAMSAGAAVVFGGAPGEGAAWICTPAELQAMAPPPSRAGPLAPWLRRVGRMAALGRLARVFVAGPVPAEAAAYTTRGVEVGRWEP